ncbi:hypothetical protein MTO96_042055 [Rhipicephalus appendiculatus]
MVGREVMEATRKRARLENQAAYGPLVSLSAILDLAKETQRCVVEGEGAFNAGHIICCGIRETTSEAVQVESLCLQTSAIKGPPHTIKVQVCNTTGAVKGECTCKAGLSGQCKHVFATLIYLNRTSATSLDSLSCTDVQQQWGRASAASLYKPRPISLFCHVEQPQPRSFPEDIQAQIRKELIEAAKDSALAKHKTRTRKLAPVTCSPSTVHATDRIFTQGCYLKDYTKFLFFESVLDGGKTIMKRFTLENLIASEKTFYIENVCLSYAKAKEICHKTSDQASTLWHSERKKRITGSICRELYTFEESGIRTWEAKLERLYCRDHFKGNEATRYGIDNESLALEEYARTHKERVSKLGLVVIPAVPWLGYSPDGISEQRGTSVLLEVKCPIQGQQSSIKDLVNAKKMAFLARNGENYALKPAHKYYSQVQLGMLLLNMKVCHFIVYSKVESLVIPVQRDTEHIQQLVERLQYVYFKKVLPKLVQISKA